MPLRHFPVEEKKTTLITTGNILLQSEDFNMLQIRSGIYES